MVTILYFASIKEKIGIAKESIELPSGISHVSALADALRARGNVWEEALKQDPRLKVAVNQIMTTFDQSIKDGDEIAFFPPVTGG